VTGRALTKSAGGSTFLISCVEAELACTLGVLWRFDEAIPMLEQAKSSAAEAGRLDQVLRVIWNLAFIAYRQGDASVKDLLSEGVRIAESSGDPDLVA